MDFNNDTASAQVAVTAAKRRNLTVPQSIYDARTMLATVQAAGHMERPPKPTAADIPATPEELAALITERAHAHRIAEAHRQVADDFIEPIARNYNRLVRDAVPGWIAALQPEFDGAVKAIRSAAKKLPDDLRTDMINWNDPVVAGAWEKAQGAAAQLDQIVNDRLALAKAIGSDGGRDAELYAVAAFPEPDVDLVMRGHWLGVLHPVMADWKDHRGQPVARWVTLVRSEALGVELRLAVPDEVRQRAGTVERWQAGSVQIANAHSRGSARQAAAEAIRPRAA